MRKVISGAVAAALVTVWGATGAIATVDDADELVSDASVLDAWRLPTQVEGLNATVTAASARIDSERPLSVTTSVTNSTSSIVDDVSVSLELTTQAFDDGGALAAFLDDPSGFAFETVATAPSEDTADAGETDSDNESDGAASEGEGSPDGNADEGSGDEEGDAASKEELTQPGVSLSPSGTQVLTAEAEDLDLGDAGVYGMAVHLHVADESVLLDALPVSWTENVTDTVDLAVLVEATGTTQKVDQTLSVADDPRVAVAVDPALLTNAMVLDGGLLEREVMWVPAGDVDITSLAHAEDPRLLEASVSVAPPASLAASVAAPWIAPVPALDESSVSMASSVGAAAVVPLHNAVGVDEARAEANGATAVTVGESAAPTLLPHAGLTAAFTSYRTQSPAPWSMVVAQTLLAAQADQGPALLAPGDAWLPTAASPTLMGDMLDLEWVNPIAVSDLLDDTAPAITLESTRDADADLAPEHVHELGDYLEPFTDLAAATTNPDEAYDTWSLGLISGVTALGREGPASRDISFANATHAADDVLTSLRIASTSDLNLLAQDGDVPVTVENDLDWDAEVTVRLLSNSPNLVVEEAPTLVVPANESQAGLVEVSAVSSANVELTAQLLTPEGIVIGETQTYSVRVRADWGTAATLIFTVLLVLLLIAGVIRTIRRGRKDTRTDAVVIPDSEVPASSVASHASPASRDSVASASSTTSAPTPASAPETPASDVPDTDGPDNDSEADHDQR